MANWKDFGHELRSGNLGNAFRSLTAGRTKAGGDDVSLPFTPEAYRNGFYFFGSGQTVKFFEYDGQQSAVKAFLNCSPLQSILMRKGRMSANAKVWVMTNSGKGRDKEASSLYAEKVRKRLAEPNPYMTANQFNAYVKLFTDLFGWCVIYPTYSATSLAKYGFSEANALWPLPPYMLTWKETGRVFNQAKLNEVFNYIRVDIGGYQLDLPLDQILIVKDDLPRMSDGLQGTNFTEALILPDTKVRACESAINNIIGALEARGELISHRGAAHLISPDSTNSQYAPIPLTDEDQKELQEKFRAAYGIRAGQWRHVFSPQPLQATKLSTPTKDLALFEEVEADIMALCDQFGYDYKLLSNIKSVSLNGNEAKERKAQVYQDAIIPETNSIYQQLAVGFKAADNNCRFEVDFSSVPVLQKDRKVEAEARRIMGQAVYADFRNNLITLNRALELLGEDKRTDGDVYYNEWAAANGAGPSNNNPALPTTN